jgi:heterodisulfide reductase subunit B
VEEGEDSVKYLYYPGCSVNGTAVEFEESFLAVAPLLGIEAREITDWACCGATVAKSVDADLARNRKGRISLCFAPPAT